MTGSEPRPTMAITMAGFGARFRQAGFGEPKYMIQAAGKTLFERAVVSLQGFIEQDWAFVFAVRRDDQARGFIEQKAAALGVAHVHILELNEATDGQATTALLASAQAHPLAPFAIFNIDTAIAAGVLRPPGSGLDGWIPCFKAQGDHWSFVRIGSDGFAAEVREKTRISDLATLGLYWSASAELYGRLYERRYRPGAALEAGERYVAPLFQELIASGGRVGVSMVEPREVGLLGTPKELEAFLQTQAAGGIGIA